MEQDGRSQQQMGVGRDIITGRGTGELFADFFRREMGRDLDEVERGRLAAALRRLDSRGGDAS